METNQKQFLIRQGDIALKAVPHLSGEIPNSKVVAKENGRVVLAHGEVTGHCHAIDSNSARLLETEDGRRFLKLVAPEQLVHDEHSAIELPAGTYEVIRQCEYTPGAIRQVAD